MIPTLSQPERQVRDSKLTLCYEALVHVHVLVDACDVRDRSEKVSDYGNLIKFLGESRWFWKKKKTF